MKLSEHVNHTAEECKSLVNTIRTNLFEMYNGEMDDFILNEMITEYDNVLFNGKLHKLAKITCSWDDDSYFTGEFTDAAGITGCEKGQNLHIAINGPMFEKHGVSLWNLFQTLELQLVFCMQSIVRGKMEIDDEVMDALKVWFDGTDVEHDFW